MGVPASNAVRYRRGRITTPDWTAEFVTDGRVRKADPQLDWMIGYTDDEVRAYVSRKGLKLTRVLTDLDKAAAQPLVHAILVAFPGSVVKAVRPHVWEGDDVVS